MEIEAKGDGVGKHRLGGEEADLESLGHLDPAKGHETFLRGRRDLGVVLHSSLRKRRRETKASSHKKRQDFHGGIRKGAQDGNAAISYGKLARLAAFPEDSKESFPDFSLTGIQ
jgi:hypothetical protein